MPAKITQRFVPRHNFKEAFCVWERELDNFFGGRGGGVGGHFIGAKLQS